MTSKPIELTTAFALAALVSYSAPVFAANPRCVAGRPCGPVNCHPQTEKWCGVERGQKVCKSRTIIVCL
jgi:hypothetical protein